MSAVHWLDWLVLCGTLLGIVAYGVYQTRGSRNISGFLLGNKSDHWWTIGISVMATQASAITFLSTPGLAYESGMRFVQNYFGMPLAIIIICVFFIPIYYRLKVYTAYEYLERRFDFKTRTLGALLFFIQRGLAAGITIYAPAIILSTLLQWPLQPTILATGILVIIYTISGGTRAVSLTQKYQMGVIFLGMLLAFFLVVRGLPPEVGFVDALHVAGKMDRLEAVDFSINFDERYTFWSGMLGGLFLMLSYFGTDQSQVQRYLSGRSVAQSRIGLLFNALFKVPMQFFILMVGVMVFVFYQFVQPPVYFKTHQYERVKSESTELAEELDGLEKKYQAVFEEKREKIHRYLENPASVKETELQQADSLSQAVRAQVKSTMLAHDTSLDTNDSDYIFLTYVLTYLPHGVIGLLLAVIFSAAMSSTASELNALASTSTVDIYKRIVNAKASDEHYVMVSKLLTAGWGILAISFALIADLVENLVEFINILGSLFYGTILGIFLVAFFLKRIQGDSVFYSAIIAQFLVLLLFFISSISYLWYNLIGCAVTVILALVLHQGRYIGVDTGSDKNGRKR